MTTAKPAQIRRTRRNPQPGDVWRSRVRGETDRTVIVLDVPDLMVHNTRIHIQTLTSAWGIAPMRRTRTRVMAANWHGTFTYHRPATPDERAAAGLTEEAPDA